MPSGRMAAVHDDTSLPDPTTAPGTGGDGGGPDGVADLDLEGLAPELLRVAERAAREAGELVRSRRPRRVDVAATKSSPVDVVTEMDLAAERLITRVLRDERPDDGMLGEEEGLRPGTSGVTWVVDPVDGTVNYLYGIPAYAVSVAAVVGPPEPGAWTVLAGCVHAVVDGRTWTAARGHGARLDGVVLAPVGAADLAGSLVGTGFGYTTERRRAQARVVAEVLPRVRDVRRIGSAAMDLCSVASGELDLYYERGLNPWDMAAGVLVAQEAGATVRGLRGAPPGPAMTVAGLSPAVDELVGLLEDLDADTG